MSEKLEITPTGKAALQAYCYGGKTFESREDAIVTMAIHYEVPLGELGPIRNQLRRLFEAGYIDYEGRNS